MNVVYALEDPRDNLYHYIGITDDVYSRFIQHVTGSAGNIKKNMWIFECRQANIMILMRELEQVEMRKDAEQRETFWISHYLRLGHPLRNLAKVKKIVQEELPRAKPEFGVRRHALSEVPYDDVQTMQELMAQGYSERIIAEVAGCSRHQVRKAVGKWKSTGKTLGFSGE